MSCCTQKARCKAVRSLRLLQELTSGGTGAPELLLGGLLSDAASPGMPDLRVVSVEDFLEDVPRAGPKPDEPMEPFLCSFITDCRAPLGREAVLAARVASRCRLIAALTNMPLAAA